MDIQSPPPHQIEACFRTTADSLDAAGLPSHSYTIPQYAGYAVLTGQPNTPVYCLESYLGPTHNKPGYSSYGIAQSFHPRYPSVVLVLMINRRDEDRALDTTLPVFSPNIDRAFSTVFLPTMHKAFNTLDPSGHNKGQLVQAYNANMTLSNLIPSIWLSVRIITTFKRDGQLASIAADFDDTLQTLVAHLLKPFHTISALHHIPRTTTPSAVRIPFHNTHGEPYTIDNCSSALDTAFSIAYQYMEKNYQF